VAAYYPMSNTSCTLLSISTLSRPTDSILASYSRDPMFEIPLAPSYSNKYFRDFHSPSTLVCGSTMDAHDATRHHVGETRGFRLGDGETPCR
jgi:hypothetical protein